MDNVITVQIVGATLQEVSMKMLDFISGVRSVSLVPLQEPPVLTEKQKQVEENEPDKDAD